YAVLASKKLAAEYANNEALGFLNHALQLASEPSTRYELLWLRQEIHDRIGDRRAQQDDLTQLQLLVEQGDDLVRKARVSNAWADYHRNTSNYLAAIDAVQRAWAFAQQAQDLAAEARSLTLWGQVLEHQGAYQGAREHYEQALAIYRQLGYRRGQANCLSSLS